MRSTLIFLALSLSAAALPAAATYSSPLYALHANSKPQTYERVQVDFFNSKTVACELHVKNDVIHVPAFTSVRLHVPVHTSVIATSEYDSHMSQVVLEASEQDNGRTVFVQ